jgi:hypothetical protein
VVATTGCTAGLRRPPALIPHRPADQLAREIQSRHADLIDAARLGDTARLSRDLMATALLVTPTGDSIRGVGAIARALTTLRATLPIESVRGSIGSDLTRCRDGVLERAAEWSVSMTAPDSSVQFRRGPVAIQWVARKDSLAASIIELFTASVSPASTGCQEAGVARFAARRIALEGIRSVYTFASYEQSANASLRRLGYAPNLANVIEAQNRFPDGSASAPSLYMVSARLTNRVWVTAAAQLHPEVSEDGRCNPSTYNYVDVGRTHKPAAVMLDLQLPHGFSIGAGPAVARDHYRYRDYDFYPRPPDQTGANCGGSTVLQAHDSSSTARNAKGDAASLMFEERLAAHLAFISRLQLFRFPTAPAPTASRGFSLAFRDVTATLGIGVALTY